LSLLSSNTIKTWPDRQKFYRVYFDIMAYFWTNTKMQYSSKTTLVAIKSYQISAE